MSLKTEKNNNVVTQLASSTKLPKMAKVRQILDDSHIPVEEIPKVVFHQLEASGIRQTIKPGMSIAITCGSRGVANIAAITKAIVDFVKDCKAIPFVFPAMGSHGGATAKGQADILAGYGVTEETIGCPIVSSMDTIHLTDTEEGLPVFIDRNAYEADGIILCGRVKPHTAFRGPYESGILKMAVIGMGKQKGADHIHRDGFYELGRMLPLIAKPLFENTKILGALAVVENAFDKTCLLKGMVKDEIFDKEPEILKIAKDRLGKIHFDDIDVLVIDRIGKDISGDGMDPNIVGRFAVPHVKGDKKVQHIAVLDLTEASQGNCNGLGLADVCTKRLVDKIDVDATYPNVVTSTVLCTPKIPLFTHTDKACIQIALKTCNYIDRENPRLVRIEDTMNLEEIYISEAIYQEAKENSNIEIIHEPRDWDFNEEDNLW